MGIGADRLLPRLRSPRDRSGRFVNYSRTVTVSPETWVEPFSEVEVAGCVAGAAREHRRLHVVGAGHSWSEIAAPEGVAVSLDRLVGVVERGEGWARVRAGTRLRDLNRALALGGDALPILGSISQQSVAGAIATGTHGSSLVHGNLSSLVLGARLVCGDGTLLEIGPSDERLDGVRVHLGALGAITEVTLRTEPTFNLAETAERVPVAHVARRVQEIGGSAEYVKVWWLPHTPTALVLRYERTTEAATRRPSPATERLVENWLMHRALIPAWFAWHRRRPEKVPRFNALIDRTLGTKRRVGPSDLMFSTPDPALHYETEAALPLAAGGEAFERTAALIERVGVSVNFIVELRYVKGDQGWMSPAYGGDVVQLGAYTALPAHRRAYFDAFWGEMRTLGARPHWGKEMDHTGAEIRALYPMAGRFKALRDELDPDRVFANRFLDRVLGATETARTPLRADAI
jgi:FAD/FMN-containing dehydrogenase